MSAVTRRTPAGKGGLYGRGRREGSGVGMGIRNRSDSRSRLGIATDRRDCREAGATGRRMLGLGFAIAGLALLPGQARGQIFSDAAPKVRTLPLREQVEAEGRDARYHLGPIRLSPYLSLKDAGWNNNVFGTETDRVSDFMVTVAPGSKLQLPLGGKGFLRATGEADYFYWDKLTDRRGWGGLADGELLGLFNRVTASVGGNYTDTIQQYSSESTDVARQRQQSGRGRLEIEFLKRLSVFGGYDVLQTRLDDSGFNESGISQAFQLDRTEYGARAGLRYRLDSTLAIGLMGLWSAARFVHQAEDKDNDAVGAQLTVRYDRERFYVDLSGGYQEATALYSPSFFPEYKTGTYSYFASYFVTRTFELQAFGSRRPQYSFFLDNPYFFETRNGLGLNMTVGRKITMGGSASVGSNAYPVEVYSGAELVARRDDVRSLSGTVGFIVDQTLTLGVTLRQDRYTSNLPGADRTIGTLGAIVNWSFGMVHVSAGAR